MTSDTQSPADSALRTAHELHRAGRLEEARALCAQALQLRPQQPEALILSGIIAAQTGDPAGAVALFDQVLRLEPQNLAAHLNRGNALRILKQPSAALASYDAAIAIAPGHAAAHHQRGKALAQLCRYEAALASQERTLALQPDHPGAQLDRACALLALTRHEAALESLDRLIAIAPRHPGAWHLRGNALYSMGRLEAALESYDRALSLVPADARTWHNRGNALFMLGRPADAAASYDRAIALDPGLTSSYGERLHARMHIADWREFEAEVARLTALIGRGEAASNPFTLLGLCGSAPLQRQAAQAWVRERHPPNAALGPIPARPRHGRLRIGYFSAEFHGHATASLTAELFETHDRTRFEVIGFSLGPDLRDEMRQRLEAAFDRFLDVRAQSDADIARLARSLEIDIAVDLGGFTRGGRPGIFALRAAPVQVSYLGYLGTMSAEYMDYLVADETLVAAADRDHYAEKIAYLPAYQVNDSKRRIAARRFGREELGLPGAGFVFCCFNSTYKITPRTYDSWMRILTRVPGSVLFLLGGGDPLESNLRREARARGVDPQRIVFGGRLPAPEYLARYRAADLFLDTLPYNAGTTASDALWAGLPVLTCVGETFAGRIGASLLRAVGLEELITSMPEEYEQRAIELASDTGALTALRAKLAGDLRARPLFDTPSFARHLEAAYAAMAARYHAGLAPQTLLAQPSRIPASRPPE
ncbi:MAG TPA: tetratricopeptide repeat protein [Steroidobacteraceae bacterium]|nr:tetratricopeptide repeat protein [Steroidobacteraceae bacterium]